MHPIVSMSPEANATSSESRIWGKREREERLKLQLEADFFPIIETVGAFLSGFISSRIKIIKPLFSVAFLSSFTVFALYVILDMPAYFAALAFFAVSTVECLPSLSQTLKEDGSRPIIPLSMG